MDNSPLRTHRPGTKVDPPTGASTQPTGPSAALFWCPALLIAVADVVTNEFVRRLLLPEHLPRDVVGDVLRLTLVHNPGAAFGLSLGPHSRWIFTALTLAALVVLWRLYRATPSGEQLRPLALGLVVGGALGNLINRLWSTRGVVDFIDVGIGPYRWPTFNVADIGVTIGALALAWVLWREDGAHGDRNPA